MTHTARRHALLALLLGGAAGSGCATFRRAPPAPARPTGDVLRSAELSRIRCVIVPPVENVTDAPGAADELTRAILDHVSKSQARAVSPVALRNIFYGTPFELPDSVSPPMALELAELLGADGVLYGAVEGRTADRAPVLIIDLRVELAGARDLVYASTLPVVIGPAETVEAAITRTASEGLGPIVSRFGAVGPGGGCVDPARTAKMRALALAQASPQKGPALTLAPASASAVAATPGVPGASPAGDSAADLGATAPPVPRGTHAPRLNARRSKIVDELREGSRIVLDGLVFNGRTSSITRDAGLTDLASAVAALSDSTVRIEGFVDKTGDPESDARLSMDMARAVRDRLVRLGVPPVRLTIAGRGGGAPRLPNFTPRGRAANRRVEVVRAQ